MRKQCCFLSTDNLGVIDFDDNLAIGPLAARGWDTTTVGWKVEGADWDRFDVVVIRSTWDYHLAPSEFLELLKRIDSSTARLENALGLVTWNSSKTYLRDLQQQGVPIVPTVWTSETITPELFAVWQTHFQSDQLVIKPAVSATARHAFCMGEWSTEVATIFRDREYLVQPFIQEIVTEGEFSLIFFGGHFSHAILKSPKRGDFRVQEDFGGQVTRIVPEFSMLAAGRFVLAALATTPLYARVDFVQNTGEFKLMELELIEPSLYFGMDENAANYFAAAVDSLG